VSPVFHAPDIECEHCAEEIRQALAQVAGVVEVEVDVEACTVRVKLDEDGPTDSTIRAVLDEAGYPTSP
jgi:copper chaperone CopZ